MVPEGWKHQAIGDWLVEFRRKSEVQDEYPVMTSSRNGIILQSEYYGEGRITQRDNVGFHVLPPGYMTYRSRSDDGLFFFNMNSLGITGLVSHFYPVFHFPSGSTPFFLDLLNTYREAFSAHAVGSSQVVLSLNALRKVRLPIPPLPEQQKIAEILSTWDKAIETTEALLANARTQKRALMQSLLTGTRRFPGFEGQPWREVRLGDVASIIVSNVDKKSEPDELPVRLCNYTDVYKNDTIRTDMDFMEATATPAQIKKFGLKVGDVIITKDSEDPSDIAVPAYVVETADDLVCGYHLAIIRANDHADGRFLKFCFELPHTRYYFGARANGATRFGLNIDSIETAVFRVPSVTEQQMIAATIQEVEQEIDHITNALDYLRTEKKSLMQQLLTGKRRVVAHE